MQITGAGSMGYDRVVTVFSPDGRLFQVQYAMEAVKRGATVVGVVSKDAVVLAADKRINNSLIIPESLEKIYEVDVHIGAATSGLVADGRKLVQEARYEAQRNRMLYDEKITVQALVKAISDIAQIFTQYGGLRPFGVSLLIGGVDKEPRLFETDPAGVTTEWQATALGEGRNEALDALKGFKEGMSTDDAIVLAIKALNKALKKGVEAKRVEVAVIRKDGFKKLSEKKVKDYIPKVKSSDDKS